MVRMSKSITFTLFKPLFCQSQLLIGLSQHPLKRAENGLADQVQLLVGSYVVIRQISAIVGDRMSDVAVFSYGVPQGPIYGPLFLSVYMSL